MNIGEVAKRSGVSTRMIRHYEAVGLIGCERCANRYRSYHDSDVQALRFIRHACDLDFPLESIRRLLKLRRTP